MNMIGLLVTIASYDDNRILVYLALMINSSNANIQEATLADPTANANRFAEAFTG
jgi:hypothetical protein